jgi:superfamily II DNA or RNA helicase
MIDLYPHQIECRDAVIQDWQIGKRSCLAFLATGSGKTETALSILVAEKEAGRMKRALFLVHTVELATQPLERIAKTWPEFSSSGLIRAEYNETNREFTAATMQTIRIPERMAQLLSHGVITHLVVDECHHSISESYVEIIKMLRAANPDLRILGMTATPMRTDGDGLVRIFEKVSYRYPISKAIRNGSLVPFDALGIGLPVSFSDIQENEDGWEAESMGDILKADNVLQIVFDNWKQYAGNRSTIAFTASVAQARRTAEFFKERGINAEWVCGETPQRERRRILEGFKSGEIQVVCNMMVLTEGFDAPNASAVLMIAPTKSDLIYIQRAGRGLRLAPNKVDCRILDFAPVDGRNIIMAGDLLGKPREVKKAEEKAERAGVLFAVSVDQLGHATSIDPTRLIVKVLNLLRKDALAWALDGRYATASLGAKSSLCIELPDLPRIEKAEAFRRENPDKWTDRHEAEYRKISQYGLFLVENSRACFQGRFETMEDAKAAGDDLALDRLEGVLSEKKSTWRKDPPSEKQLDLLRRFGAQIPERCTKGQAAQLITQAMTISAVRRVRV